MVRLKGRIACHVIDRAVISIPYGSIKRLIRTKLLDLQVISIPYGSIKSSQRTVPENQVIVISIPYGSIKSDLMELEKQYHQNFNSLWFD